MKKMIYALVLFAVLGFVLIGCDNGTTGPKKYILPELDGKNQSEIQSLFAGIPITLDFETVESSEIEEGLFVSYKEPHTANNEVTAGTFVTVYLSEYLVTLPSLSGYRNTTIQTMLSDIGLSVEFAYVIDSVVRTDLFVSYGNGLNVGDGVKPNSTIKVNISYNYKLPNLSGSSQSAVKTRLDIDGIKYSFKTVNTNDYPEGTFAGYEGKETGDNITRGESIVVLIARNGVVLPDLAGKTRSEVEAILTELGFRVEFVVERTNEIETGQFVEYENFNIGDFLVDKNAIIYISIALNDPRLPDLTNKNIYEIRDTLDDLFISIRAEYVIDNNKEEDTFKEYKGYAPDDFFPQGGVIEMILYKNDMWNVENTLFISKYIESGISYLGGLNQAIEIYNPLDVPVNLSDYSIKVFLGGALTATSVINLSGTLAPNDTYLVVRAGATSSLLSLADLVAEGLNFDGNDTVQLVYKTGTYIDTIYQLSNSVKSFSDEVFIRAIEVRKGTRIFNINEWDAYVPWYYDEVGTHPVIKPTEMIMDMSLLANPFGDPHGSLIQVYYSYQSDGDTVAFTPGFTGDARVRFLGVDTPETYPIVEPWGQEAKDFTYGKIMAAENSGGLFYLQSDPYHGHKETYGRTLAYVWIDGKMQNVELVRYGFSRNELASGSSLVFSNRYIYRWFQDAEREAIANRRGIWS